MCKGLLAARQLHRQILAIRLRAHSAPQAVAIDMTSPCPAWLVASSSCIQRCNASMHGEDEGKAYLREEWLRQAWAPQGPHVGCVRVCWLLAWRQLQGAAWAGLVACCQPPLAL